MKHQTQVMANDTDSTLENLVVEHDEKLILPRSITNNSDTPIVVILMPERNDEVLDDYCQFSFNRLAAMFQKLGAHAIAVPWSTAPLTFASPVSSILYVANLVWGYHTVVDHWEKWLRAWPKDTMLINSPLLISWNTRKTYLKELEQAGIPVIPTLYVEQIDEKTLIEAATHFLTSELVVKPQVSASGFSTFRVFVDNSDSTPSPKSYSVSETVNELNRLGTAQLPAMIQPFMHNVIGEGETAVLMFNGQYSHAIRKTPSFDDYRVQHEFGGTAITLDQPSSDILELAHASLAKCPEIPTYARVDMIRNHLTGCWCISELELIEPDLHLDQATDEGLAFAHAILQVRSQNISEYK